MNLRMRIGLLGFLALTLAVGALSDQASAAPPAFVQANAREVSSGTTNAVAFPSNNSAGNLVVTYVIWENQGSVTIADSRGNGYFSAVGPTAWGSCCSAQVFYAKNIAAGANTVTATFQTPLTSFGLVYIHEYSGIDTAAPVDVVAAAAGSGPNMNSGSATTTNPTDLLFGAGVSSSVVTAAGPGYVIRSNAFANITEDKNVTSTGSYSATATHAGIDWAMQMVAFKAAGGAPPSFDFVMSNGGNKSVVRGSSVNNTVTSTISSGTTVSVSYSAAGLPSGATGSFSPTSCSPTCTTTLTVNTTGSTPLGTSTITVTGTGGSVSRTTAFGLTVTAAGDTTLPTVSVTAPSSGATVAGTAVTVSAAAADNVGVVGVQLLLDGAVLGQEDTSSPYSTTWNTTASSNGPQVLSARARDAAGNLGVATNVNVTVDNQVPTGSILINNGAAATNSRTAALTLSATDVLSTVTHMRFSNTGSSYSAAEAYATTKTWTLSGGAGTKTVYVQFRDAVGNWSPAATDTIVLDTTAPTISAVSTSNLTNSSARINWTTNEPATSQVEYGTTTAYGQMTVADTGLVISHSVVISGLASQTTYNYRVRSKDAASNERIGTNNSFTTQAGPDTTAPTVPGGLAATVISPTQVNLVWNASTDNVGVTGYDVFRNGVQVASRTVTSFQDTGAARATTYSYAVAARDAAGNVSALSAPASATTPALIIGSVVSSSITTSSATISWTTDVAADGQIEYGTTVGYGQLSALDATLTTSHSRTINGLTAGTVYHYRARSRDGSGNLVVSGDFVFTTLPGGGPGTFQNEILTTGLNLPTILKFLPDGRMIVGELGGNVWILRQGATQVDPVPFLQLTNIGSGGERGLNDIVLDPDFANNGRYYIFYNNGSSNRDRVSRFTTNGFTTNLSTEVVIYQDDMDARDEHHGGSLNFGFDGKLYITTGEHFIPQDAQSLSSYHGKILRINNDGTIPTDNPFYDGPGPNKDAIWALGLRNPYRAYIDPGTGKYYIGDVGGNDVNLSIEKVNQGVRGANYSWPICEYEACTDPGYTGPIHFYSHGGRDAAITGGFIYHGSQFPNEYVGNYFFADYAQRWIKRLTFDGNGNVDQVLNFWPSNGSPDGPWGDITYLAEGPDGALYYVDAGFDEVTGTMGPGSIRRIRFVGSGNQAPVAVASANPVTGQAPLVVNFTSSGSSDPEGQPLTYLWEFGDGGTSTAANPSHTYVQAGQYTIRLTVSDGVNSTLASPVLITVGNRPVVNLTSPQDGTLFRAGATISFSGDATDTEDGILPASAFAWNVDFHHETHTHPGLPINGVKSGSFQVPVSGHDFNGTTFYEFRLTVTDSSGLQASRSAFVYPEKVNITIDTLPSGLTVNLDGIPRTTPFTYSTLIGFNHVVQAPNQTQGTNSYTFASWSDGGTQNHTLVVPTTAQSYVATYSVTSNPLPPGLIAAYSMNEGSGTVLRDASGINNGTVSGVTWAPGKYGQALSFNGSGNVIVPHAPSISLASSFTLSAWINPASLSGYQTILIKDCNYWLQMADDQISAGMGNCSEHRTTGATIPLNTWSYITAVFDDVANQYRIYVNGNLVASQTEGGANVTNGESLLIGQTSYAPANFERWNGLIDEVRIYNRALTQSEIQSDMNTPLP